MSTFGCAGRFGWHSTGRSISHSTDEEARCLPRDCRCAGREVLRLKHQGQTERVIAQISGEQWRLVWLHAAFRSCRAGQQPNDQDHALERRHQGALLDDALCQFVVPSLPARPNTSRRSSERRSLYSLCWQGGHSRVLGTPGPEADANLGRFTCRE